MARPSKTKSRIKGQKAPPKRHAGSKFTMQQEARNTEGRNIWRYNSQLRYKTVNFVSAGDMKLEEENANHPPKPEEAAKQQQNTPKVADPSSMDQESHAAKKDAPLSVDMLGEGIASTEISDPSPEQRSVDDQSSEDEVVFVGRQRILGWTDSSSSSLSTQHKKSGRPAETNLPKMAQRIYPPEAAWNSMAQGQRGRSTSRREEKSSSAEDTGFISIKPQTQGRSDRNDHHCYNDDDDDGFLADYIANMDDEYLDRNSSSSADEEAEESPGAKEIAKATLITPKRNEADLEATLLAGVLPARATSEIEQSVDCEGIYQKKHTSAPETTRGEITSSDTSESEAEETGTDGEDNSQIIEGIIRELEESNSRLQRAHHRHKGRRLFAPAAAFADALESDPYYGFDVMDFGRPSLQLKNKGKRRSLDLELSDSDLELELEKAWRNDREKKSNKKRERQYLRSQGLLGRDSNDPDLRKKHASSMSFDDLNGEICAFLLSSKNSLPLPPMAKQRRKVVHALAHDLCLNSQSKGKGSTRFTILHKTSRTPRYTPRTIDETDRIFSKSKFKHGGAKIWDQQAKKSAKARPGRPDGNVSYMDGDIVGASAPEIGAGNKGRAMLERMGWSTGTALGAANNKGILLPVAHVVKNTKAGLG